MSADGIKIKPAGPYTLWQDYGYEGWQWTDFATLREALEAERYCANWTIQKHAAFTVAEGGE